MWNMNCFTFQRTWVHARFSGVCVVWTLVLCACFAYRCLSFCPFGHCVLCPSSISGFWLDLCYLQTLLELVLFYCVLHLPIKYVALLSSSHAMTHTEYTTFHMILWDTSSSTYNKWASTDVVNVSRTCMALQVWTVIHAVCCSIPTNIVFGKL